MIATLPTWNLHIPLPLVAAVVILVGAWLLYGMARDLLFLARHKEIPRE